MDDLFRVAFVSLILGAVGLAADPVADLWLLETDHKTAGILKKALLDDTMTASQTEDCLDAMVKDRTLIELARFKQQFSSHGQLLKFEKNREDIKIADGEVMTGGIILEAEPTVGYSGLVDLRFAFDRSVEEGRNKIEAARTNTAACIKSDRWEILSDWGDEKQTTLLLARFSGVTLKKNPAPRRLLELRCDSEIRWCEPSDLKKFERSTPATRSKAVAWLKGQGELIATSGMRMRGGQRSMQQNILQWIHDDNGWDTSELGWTLDFQGTIGPKGRLLDVQLNSQWHPRDAKSPPSKPQFSYEFAATAASGTTLVIEPKTRPDSGPVPVIFVTPTILIVEDAEEPAAQYKLPEAGNIGVAIYQVHPSLIRKLAEITRFDPHANPGVIAQPVLKDMLENMGLEFPAGTSAIFDATRSEVMLNHNRQGHQRFKAILENYKLSMAAEDKADS